MRGNKPVVIDVGTGYTKMGLASNAAPEYIIPSVLGMRNPELAGKSGTLARRTEFEDLDYVIGYECMDNLRTYPPIKFMNHGLVSNWDGLEKFLQACYFRYLRCNPEDHPLVLTEPPLNTPENREYLAEILFETFNVPSMYIGVQAVLAICASWISKHQQNVALTGTVVDSGDGVTHIIPVFDGAVIPSAIKHIPIAGGDVTKFILDMIRDREHDLPPDEAIATAKYIKENYCYVTSDLLKEFDKFDKDQPDTFIDYKGTHQVTQKPYTVGVGYERFLAPEIFFQPEILQADFTVGIPQLVDQAVQMSPVDTRRALYGNVVLSGGSTMFSNYHKRLQKELQGIVNDRLHQHEVRSGGVKPTPIDVKVISHKFQRYAVFLGGTMLGNSEIFATLAHTKKEYDEIGPAVCRTSATFQKL